MKLVTPLSFILAAFANAPAVGVLLFYVGIAPVITALLQIGYLTIRHPDKLMSEPHIEEMARINRGQITQNNADGSNTKVASLSDRVSDNPGMGATAPVLLGSDPGVRAE